MGVGESKSRGIIRSKDGKVTPVSSPKHVTVLDEIKTDPMSDRARRSTITDSRNFLNKREPHRRIFVNRTLRMEKIKFYGFDMDYTLADYHSPAYESFLFRAIIERLVVFGYPKEILDFEYDPTFPCRGLWYDTKYACLLKVDPFGNIMVAVKGFHVLTDKELETNNYYTNKFVSREDGTDRFIILNTLFDLPELYVLACLTDYFVNSKKFSPEADGTGVKHGDLRISFKSIHQDVRDCTNWVHSVGTLKQETVKDMAKYVVKDIRLGQLLDRLRQSGAKTFLLTNSKYDYTNNLMRYMLDTTAELGPKGRTWTSYFDYVIVDACKPNFFEEGSTLREIDMTTGEAHIGFHSGSLQQGKVYCRGNCAIFSELIGAVGSDVLYTGDHIFGDILKSKKRRGWKTFLVVPEIAHEVRVWVSKREQFETLSTLETKLNHAYYKLDSSSGKASINTTAIENEIQSIRHLLDLNYGFLGSLFRSGSRPTYFASQVSRYADLYGASFLNMFYYPFFYLFKAPTTLMPHESTVDQYAYEGREDEGEADSSKDLKSRAVEHKFKPRQSLVPHLRAATPKQLTYSHD